MNNFLRTIQEGLRRVRKVWIITAVVVVGLVLGLAGFASGAFGRAIAAIRGETAVASVNNQAVTTPTMAAMPGMETPTAVPAMPGMLGMETPTAVSGNNQPSGGDDLDALTLQMQEMMKSLDGMMGQLDQKGANANLPPTATPIAAVDMQAVMAEMQSINREMGPLMLRIQADLQGNPSAEELASVRAQVLQINTRIGNLLFQIQTARGNAAPGMASPGMEPAPTMQPMPGMGQHQPAAGGQQYQSQAMMTRLDQMMQQMQDMLHQMQSGSTANHPGSMAGMNMASPTPMPGMGGTPPQATPMPGMGTMPGMSGSNPAMDDMMKKMDDMMAMMDSMMGMGGMTAMPGMSTSDPSMKMMDDMMMMMDNMMMMMDNMMKMDMMGMPDM